MNKLKVFILSVLAVIFGSCSNAQDNKKNVSNSNSENMEGKKVLVAYFSWSGNTKSVAEYIAAKPHRRQGTFHRPRCNPHPNLFRRGICLPDFRKNSEILHRKIVTI